MQLSFSSLLSDTKNFIHNNFKMILLVLIALAVIEQVIYITFMPNPASLIAVQSLINNTISTYGDNSIQSMQKMIDSMSPEQQKILFTSIFSYIYHFFMILVGMSLITSSFSLSLISNLVKYHPINIKELFLKATNILLTMLLFLFASIPYFLILFIVATIISPLMFFVIAAGILFYTIISNLFIVYSVDASNKRFLEKLNNSWQIFKKQYKLILPIIAIWFGILMLFNALNSPYDMDNNLILNVCISLINLLINFFTFTYLYRLCSLIKVTN